MAEMKKMNGESLDIVEQNIEQLKTLFPEVFAQGKINFNQLQEILGNYIAEDEDHYNFTWHGKLAAGRFAQTPSTGTLRPYKDESLDWDTTQNLFIEGDNLEVLKLLQKSYHRQVKLIYIDPPYNTGGDFIYPDKYKDNLDTYLKYTGQIDGNGMKFSSNTEAGGRFHTNWLNMVYPRLKLAKNLLCEEGAIFISIDDNEQANIKKLCDQVFGEENFIATFPWRKRTTKSDVPFSVSQDFEWVISYAKSDSFRAGEESQRKYHSSPDFPNDRWRLADLTTQKIEEDRPNSAFDLVDPKTGKIYPYNPNRLWGITKDTFDSYYKRGKIVFPNDYDFLKISKPAYRVFESEDKAKALKKYGAEDSIKSASTSLPKDVGMNEDGNKELFELFGKKAFSFPKPMELIKYFITIANGKDAIVVDFFAGSGTTAHAVMQLNAEDGGKRRHISIQLPEHINKKAMGFKNIAEICKQRIRLASEKIKSENPNYEGDLGFKVFKLDSSNIKRWEASFETLEDDLVNAVDYIKSDRSEEDIIYELLLKEGLDLTVPIESRIIDEKTVYSIGSGSLVICLDKEISMNVVKGIGALKEELKPEAMSVIFKDDGFKDDVVKTNVMQALKRFGIEDIKSL